LAFLLIIYFIVIAGFNANKGFLMNLPAKDSVRIAVKEDILRYELDGAGVLIDNGRPVGIETAGMTIRSAAARNPEIALVLTVSPAAPWQSVVSFVELAQKLNVGSFSFRMGADDAILP
jgi:biopolymer transport protein ExbD